MGTLNDLRYAARTWRQTPATACAVVVSLAFGLSANLTIFGWVDALVARPLSGVPAQDRLVVVDGRSTSGRDQRLSYPDLRDLSGQLRQIDGIAGYTYQSFGLSDGAHAERIWGQLVTANFFDVLRVRPMLGRAFAGSEEPQDAGPVAVISEPLWRRRFNGAPDITGQTIQVNGQRVTIVGVAPPGFHGVAVGLLLDIWIPIGMQPLLGGGQPNRLLGRDVRWLGAYARLRDGTTLAALRDELHAVGARLRAAYRENDATSFTATTLSDAPWGGTTVVKPVLRVLAVLAVLLLLVASANVTSLLLVRAIGRRREIAARMALGASRVRLARQLFMESALVGAVATAAAAAAALLSTRLFEALLPPTGFPVGFKIAVDGGWFAKSLLLAIGTIVLVGVVPVLHALSTPLVTILREEASGVVGEPRRARLRTFLMGTQVALSVVLLMVSGMLVKALASSRAVDTGFDRQHVLLAAIDLSEAGHSAATGAALLRLLHRELARLPDVVAVSFAQRVPLDLRGRGLVTASIDGYTPAQGEDVSLALNHVGPDYLRTLRIPLIEGREFGVADDESGARVAMVNERAAGLYWGTRGAINRQITINGTTVRVIGVYADIRQDGLVQAAPPALLLPVLQAYRPAVVLHIAVSGDPASLAAPVREAVARLDPTVAVYDVRTMSAHMEVPTFSYRLGSTLSLTLGMIALMLTGLGLYASVSRDIDRRRTEMGVRMALGATRIELIRFLGSRAVGTVAAGIAVGVAAAIVAGRALGGMIDGVEITAISLYVIGVTVTSVACGVAILVPIRTAVMMTPIAALRER